MGNAALGIEALKRLPDDLLREVNVRFLSEISGYVRNQPAFDEKHETKLTKLTGLFELIYAEYIETGSINFPQLFIASRYFERYVRSLEGESAQADFVTQLTREKTESARLAPLRARHGARKGMRERCQRFAVERWAGAQRELRLADMCQEVWRDAHNWLSEMEAAFADDEETLRVIADFRLALPDKPDGLKVWLRPVAPKSASAPGRPKKM